MARIVGVNIPDNKSLYISLTYIYGIGRSTALKICKNTKLDSNTKVKNLNDNDLEKIRTEISKIQVEGDLRREIAMNIKKMIDMGSYKGIRHRKSLPVRGQRTRTNAYTRKGHNRSSIRG